MSSVDGADASPRATTSRNLRCAIYGCVAVIGLVVTWLPNLSYSFGGFMAHYMSDLTVTPASRSYTGDLTALALAAAIVMVLEGRKHGVKFVWLYVFGGFATAISFTFPLFLIARELRLEPAGSSHTRRVDVALLVTVALLAVGQIVWVSIA